MSNKVRGYQIPSLLLLLLVAVATTSQVAEAKPQSRAAVLNIAAAAIPEWKLDVYAEFAQLGSLLGDKGRPINTIEDLQKVEAGSNKIWRKYLQHRDSWTKKLFNEVITKPPTTAIHMIGKLDDAIRKCNYQGYKDLVQAYDAAVGREDRVLDAKDQVKSAVIAAISLHGKICRSTYYNRYKDIYTNNIHEYMLGLMDWLFDKRFLAKVFPDDTSNHHQAAFISLSSNTAAKIKENSDLLVDKLMVLVERTQYKKYISYIHSEEFNTEITTPLLVQPCEEFTVDLNDVFYPASIDLAPDDGKITEINYQKDERFLDIWKKFIICSAIKQNHEEIDVALRMSAFSKMQPKASLKRQSQAVREQ